MISRKIIKKPRKRHHCGVCGGVIEGEHVYSFSSNEYGKPMWVRVCRSCSLSGRMSDDFRLFAEKNLSPQLFQEEQ